MKTRKIAAELWTGIRHAASLLTGAKRRRFQAEMATEYCNASPRRTESWFGFNRLAVKRGLLEKETGKAAGLNNRTSKPTKIAEGRQVAVVGVEGEKDRSTLVEPATATCLPDAISDRSRVDCTMLMRIARQSAHLTLDIRLDGS